MIRLISWLSVVLLLNVNAGVLVYKLWYKPLKVHNLELKEAAELKDFTIKAMNIAPAARLSDSKKKILADKIVSTVMRNIEGKESRESYISMLKIESNFENSVKSPMSAVGIGQIMPTTFKYAAEKCNLKVTAEDIYNEDLNILVGSCYYNILLTENEYNPRLAAISYNGGPKTVAALKKLSNMNLESANYFTKMQYVKELARR